MPIDGRSDLYALGCVAWWLLTSSEVFPRPDEESAILSHVHDPVPALRPRVRGWLPPELEAIIQLLLAKQPDDRPANARVLIDLLRAVPIPAEHAWDERRAQSWWYVHRPRAAEDAAPAASGGRLLIPQRAVSTPDAVTAADRPAPIATISARRSR
jgi:serine/threonine-protein kinase